MDAGGAEGGADATDNSSGGTSETMITSSSSTSSYSPVAVMSVSADSPASTTSTASGCSEDDSPSPSIMSASKALSANSSISSSISGGSLIFVGTWLDMLSSDIWTPLRFPKPDYQRSRLLSESASNPAPKRMQSYASVRKKNRGLALVRFSVCDAGVGGELEEGTAIQISEKRVVHASVLADRHHVGAHIMIVEFTATDMCAMGVSHESRRLEDQ